MLQEELHSAILSTFINLPFVIKIHVCLFLSGRYTQVLLYVIIWKSIDMYSELSKVHCFKPNNSLVYSGVNAILITNESSNNLTSDSSQLFV